MPHDDPPAEPSFLYSNRSYWYPQAPVSDYATARDAPHRAARRSTCVASGELDAGLAGARCRARRPVAAPQAVRVRRRRSRCATSRSSSAGSCAPTTRRPCPASTTTGATPLGESTATLNSSVEANPRQVQRGRELARARRRHRAVLRSRSSATAPYPSFTLALVESDLPGGHSPAYFALLNQPLPTTPLRLAQRPGGVRRLPGVLPRARARAPVVGPGGRLAELPRAVAQRGLRAVLRRAVRAAAARRRSVFADVLRQIGEWAHRRVATRARSISATASATSGRQPRLPRARLQQGRGGAAHAAAAVGDEAFFRGLRRFYRDVALPQGGTDDFRTAMEAEAGRPLERFFEPGSTARRCRALTFTLPRRTATRAPVRPALRAGRRACSTCRSRVTLQYADGTTGRRRRPASPSESVETARPARPAPLRRAESSMDEPRLRNRAISHCARAVPIARTLSLGPRPDMIASLWKPSR